MDKLCGQCAWNEGGRWCRKKYKDVAYFAQEPCFTTDEEYHLLLAQDIMKVESNTKKLTQDANQMESNTNIKTKVCKECGRELPIESFQRQVRSSDGYMHICKECKTKRTIAGLGKTTIDNDVHLDERGLKANITGEKLMESIYKSDLVMYEDGTIKMPLEWRQRTPSLRGLETDRSFMS